ncbi:glycosyltransferase family 4 protein [Chitinophaga barathri]|uniref:Glycosyltransferase family 4 protein n=1 Tax=Chitinophaga barathri TaxID=1647451 RepID=A0A3N4MQH3_9BACT|nr:glycosyltransferase family 4 protein [Chitinophaga barathri]RPD41929.1 glycosyltransferase family 4 protein [Chitinophaga barathri]
MKIAVLSPVAWRTPPVHYGPWEQMASNITEGLVAKGWDVTLFATGNSQTAGKLQSICESGYEEDRSQDAKVLECLHISHLMEQADRFDIIHNHFDFLPLTYSGLIRTPMVTTIHGFSSPRIIPVYKKYNDTGHYVSISNSDRSPLLRYAATVYNGIDPSGFDYVETPEDYLLFFGRIHPHKGTRDAIDIALQTGHRLIIAGIVQDADYFREQVEPLIDGEQIKFVGQAGPEQRNQLLGYAKALLHPIHFNEPFGLSVAEAMMCGTPVVAYNRGSMPELISHKKTGYLVKDIHEAAEHISGIGNIQRNMCREQALARFSMRKMVDDYVKVYEKVLLQTTIFP